MYNVKSTIVAKPTLIKPRHNMCQSQQLSFYQSWVKIKNPQDNAKNINHKTADLTVYNMGTPKKEKEKPHKNFKLLIQG